MTATILTRTQIGGGFELLPPLPEPVRDARVRAAVALRLTIGGARWSVQHDACRKCGGADRPHKARGLCKGCYRGRATDGGVVIELPIHEERIAA